MKKLFFRFSSMRTFFLFAILSSDLNWRDSSKLRIRAVRNKDGTEGSNRREGSKKNKKNRGLWEFWAYMETKILRIKRLIKKN